MPLVQSNPSVLEAAEDVWIKGFDTARLGLGSGVEAGGGDCKAAKGSRVVRSKATADVELVASSPLLQCTGTGRIKGAGGVGAAEERELLAAGTPVGIDKSASRRARGPDGVGARSEWLGIEAGEGAESDVVRIACDSMVRVRPASNV